MYESENLENQARDLVTVLDVLGVESEYDVTVEFVIGPPKSFIRVIRNTGKDIPAKRMAIRHLLDGNGWTKNYTEWNITETAHTVSGIEVQLQVPRNLVCKKIVTGTEMVEQVDYKNAPKVMVERETFRWECV